MTQKPSPSRPALDKQHILFFAKKAETFLEEHKHILLALKREGCRLSLLAQRPIRPTSRRQNIDSYFIAFSDHGKKPLQEALVCWKTLRLLYRLRPQIVVAYTLKPILYSALANILLSPLRLSPFSPPPVARFRLVAVFTGLGRVFLQRTPLHQALRLLLRPLLRTAAQRWVLNEHNKTFLQAFLRPKSSARTSEVLLSKDMGIDLARFCPPPPIRRSPQRPLRFLFLGRLLKAKGVSEYLQAARLLRRDASLSQTTEFWLAGNEARDDPDRLPSEELEEAVAQGVATWCFERKNVKELLSSADCLVLPSYYAEGLPRVILEAAAMRVPAIVARYPGWKCAVLENETALVCACRDTRALFKAMQAFAAMPPQKRRAMGDAARAFVSREFSQEKACRFYLSSLARVAEGEA